MASREAGVSPFWRAVDDHMQADAGLALVLPIRVRAASGSPKLPIYSASAPSGAPFPRLVYGARANSPLDTFGSAGVETSAQIACETLGPGFDLLDPVTSAVVACLDGVRVDITDVAAGGQQAYDLSAVTTDARLDADGKHMRGIVTLTVRLL